MTLLRDYAHLYSTNTIPNLQEAKAIQREVDDLKSRIASLQSQLHQHEAVISPVRRIPVEVLGEIFSLALPVTLNEWDRDQLLDFCLVCKPWRDAALAARWIWASVAVDTDQISYAFEKIVSWFNRAGDTAKSLHVATKDVDYEWGGSCTNLGSECRLGGAVLAKLLTDGPILDHLHFLCKGSDCFRNLVDAMHFYSALSKPRNRPWDCLRSLDLGFMSEWNESNYSWESILRHIPSSVTALALYLPNVYSLDDEDELPDIPLHIPSDILQRLTSVKLTSPRSWSGQTLKLLHDCQNVETLSLVIIRDLHPQDPDDSVSSAPLRPTIRLPMLRTLRLIMPFRELIQTISLLETPNLATLDLMPHSDTSGPGFAEAVLSFVSRSTCHNTLRHLIVHDCPSTEGELADLLRGLPLIAHLTLKSVPGNVFQGAFEILSTPGALAPHPLHFQLEVLELLELPEPFQLYLIESSLPRHSRRGGLGHVDVNQEPIFNSLKKLVVTHRPMQLPFQRHEGFRDGDWDPEVRALRDSGMLINVGPWEYDDPAPGAGWD